MNVYTPGSYPCALELVTASGQKHTVNVFEPRGHPKNRMSPSEVEAKFRRCTRSVLSEPQQTKIVSLVLDLENMTSISDLMTHLALGIR